ncbi:uncharacterized protein I206_106747 [Kwoniella pini CBS 10737]|uniref:SUZ domain-containing protein n=1 Tax=Kwoniella pini CBS 10737 TaxID=1296096 RepID=A0A1B9HTB3_9TREE|nr:uncharacterized protein I206_07365 [Kwoniella pini CBS 10737]OCF46512.1 hypothetical protein I206_07365 [Kwoniella pini CBS 10737]
MSVKVEEDDWETADISLPSSTKTKPLAPPLPTLRPQAQSFQPRPSQSNLNSSIGYNRNQNQNQNQPQASSSRQPKLLKRNENEIVEKEEEKEEEVEDDWFRGNKPMSNRQIWDSANSRSIQTQILYPQPLPEPKVQLLRRPINSSSSSNSSSNLNLKENNQKKSLVEREEQYRLARERIFGQQKSNSPNNNDDNIINDNLNKNKRENSLEGKKRNNNNSKIKVEEEELNWNGLIPSQIKSGSNTPNSFNRQSPISFQKSNNVVRQPLGPGNGIGFGSPTTGEIGSPSRNR